MTLEAHSATCTWIGDSPRYQPVCCKKSVLGKSYCEDHVFLVYQQGTAKARRKKDERIAAAVWNLESEFEAAVQELIEEGFDI